MVPAEDNELQQSLPTSSLSTTMSTRRVTRTKSSRSEAGAPSTSVIRAGENASKGMEVTEETVLEERGRLLRQKQTQLDQIFNKHDDLVRLTLALASNLLTSVL